MTGEWVKSVHSIWQLTMETVTLNRTIIVNTVQNSAFRIDVTCIVSPDEPVVI